MKLSKAEQARINGAKSKGAKTPEGLQRCRQASITHGMYVADISTFPHEDQRNYAAIWAAVRDQFQPRNAFEDALVSLLADATWRSTRLGALANADISREMSVIGRQAMNDIEPVEVHLRAEQQSKTVERLESRARHYTREIIRITELLRKLRTLPVSAEASQVVDDIYDAGCPTPRENPVYPPMPARKPVASVDSLPQKGSNQQRK